MKTGGAVCILWDLITTQQPSWASCSLPIYRYGPESPLHHCSAAAACTHARMHGCKLMQLQDTRSETGSTWTCPRCIRADVIRRKNTGFQSLAGEGVGGDRSRRWQCKPRPEASNDQITGSRLGPPHFSTSECRYRLTVQWNGCGGVEACVPLHGHRRFTPPIRWELRCRWTPTGIPFMCQNDRRRENK